MRAIFLFAFTLLSQGVSADFKSAYGHYLKGHYELAIPEFQTLANLGHVQSQYMLGQAYESGRGVSTSKELAYAWYLLAKDNGHFEAESAFKNIRQKVPSKRRAKQAYLQLKQQTNIEKLSDRLFPIFTDFALISVAPLRALKQPQPELSWSERNRSGLTLLQFNLDASGNVEHPQVLFSYPDNKTDKAVLNAFKRWQFEPVLDDEQLISRQNRLTYLFMLNPDGQDQIKPALNRYLLDEMALGNGLSFYLNALLKQQGVFGTEQNLSAYYLTAAVNGSEHAIDMISRCLLEGSWCQQDHNKAQRWLKLMPNGEGKRQLSALLRLQKMSSPQVQQQLQNELRLFSGTSEDLSKLDRYLGLLFSGTQQQKQYGLKLAQQAQLVYPDKAILSKWIIQFHLALGQRSQAQQELQMIKDQAQQPALVVLSLGRLFGSQILESR